MSNTAMRALNITDAARARAKEIKQYAFEHREGMTANRNRLSSGRNLADPENFCMQVPVGFNIAYNIEQGMTGWVQRISVYQATPKLTPHPPTVARIVEELFDIHPARNPVPGKGSGVLAEALSVEQQNLPNGCIAINLLYKFVIPTEG